MTIDLQAETAMGHPAHLAGGQVPPNRHATATAARRDAEAVHVRAACRSASGPVSRALLRLVALQPRAPVALVFSACRGDATHTAALAEEVDRFRVWPQRVDGYLVHACVSRKDVCVRFLGDLGRS